MITVHEGGGISIDGKESIALYRMTMLKFALKLEMGGMRASRNVRAFKMAKQEFGLKGNKAKIFADFCALLDEAVIKHAEWQAQEIAKRAAPVN